MKKKLLVTLFLLNLPSAFAAENTCFTDTLGSSNFLYTPAANTNNSWTIEYTITNVADVPVTVKVEMKNIDGQLHSPSGVSFFGNFSSSNNPANTAAGAVLQPGELGRLILNDNSVAMIGPAKVSWSADTCIDNAIVASFNNQFNTSSRLDRGLIQLNNGQPF